ncbi:C1QL [Mytilus edulis]|uniref:C1QL n=1 Tax=Mytilus edulis TaxID=6550 RepID=A0A8S3S0Q9_MYTED|nr:C1QL [Mytilus edulis]
MKLSEYLVLLCFLLFYKTPGGRGDVPENVPEINNGSKEFLKVLQKIIRERVEELIEKRSEELFLKLERKIKTVSETNNQIKHILHQQAPIMFQYTSFYAVFSAVQRKVMRESDSLINNRKTKLINETEHDIIQFVSKMRDYVSKTTTAIQAGVLRRYKEILNDVDAIPVNTSELLGSRVNKMLQHISNLELEVEQTIAFFATLSDNGPQNGEIIKFDNIITNSGNGYSVTEGLFTAPIDGLYTLHCSFLVVNGYVNVELVRNDNKIGRGYAAEGKHENSGSIFVTTDLMEGDEVFLP